MSTNPKVLIVGAGLGGLALAQSLRKQNVSFEIFERDPKDDARGQGWAISLHSWYVMEDAQECKAERVTQVHG